MATMNVSLPDILRDFVQNRIDGGDYASASDYVRDLIRRDQAMVAADDQWLKQLDVSIAASVAEMDAGGGLDLDNACDEISARIGSRANRTSHQ